MRNVLVAVLLGFCSLLAGCDGLRFAPSETQKRNAWLHNRTTAIAVETARAEAVSDKLQALTKLSQLQSRAFTSYYGLPKEFPQADTAGEILSQSNFQLAQAALTESAERPDTFTLVDNVFELAIGISALLGGIYGTRAVRYLKTAKTKSQALREIIVGNELYKKQNQTYADTFKESHKNQSPLTRQIVTEIKAAV
ncbi:MAG: hypothetical protein ACYS1A_02990 [Planctomycetota bacterium]|jgi:hypothetical protein